MTLPKLPKGKFPVRKANSPTPALGQFLHIRSEGLNLNMQINEQTGAQMAEALVKLFGVQVLEKAGARCNIPKEDPWFFDLAHSIYLTEGGGGEAWYYLCRFMSPIMEHVEQDLLRAGTITWTEWVEWFSKTYMSPTGKAKIEELKKALIPLLTEALAKKVHKVIDFQGITIKIDRPKGYVQQGKDEEGNAWERTYGCDYGFIPKTAGGDEEDLDVFMGPNAESQKTFWITQNKADGSFDEYKVMMGFDSPEEAKATYCQHVPEKFFGGMTEVPLGSMKSLLNISPSGMAKALGVGTPTTKVFQTPLFDQVLEEKIASAVQRHLSKDRTAPILKTTEERYILGIVLVPEEVDLQQDIYSADEVRLAAHNYMEKFRQVGDQHKSIITLGDELEGRVAILESYVAPCDLDIDGQKVKKGTWLMAFRVNDDQIWSEIKTGKRTGLSIGGSAIRVREK